MSTYSLSLQMVTSPNGRSTATQ